MSFFRLIGYLVLLAYVVACAWTAYVNADAPVAMIHLMGAVGALCALGLSLDYAGRRGELYRDSEHEIENDEAAEYLSRYEHEYE